MEVKEKRQYEMPELKDLQSVDVALGADCPSPGNGAGGQCTAPGNAAFDCYAGSTGA